MEAGSADAVRLRHRKRCSMRNMPPPRHRKRCNMRNMPSPRQRISTLGAADHYADSIGGALVNTTDDTDDATKMFFIPLIAARHLTQESIFLADLESRCGWRRLYDRGARLRSLTLCTAYTLRPLLEATESSDVKKALSTTAQTLVGQSIRIIPSCTAQIGFEQREEEDLAKCFLGMTTTPWRCEILAICPTAGFSSALFRSISSP